MLCYNNVNIAHYFFIFVLCLLLTIDLHQGWLEKLNTKREGVREPSAPTHWGFKPKNPLI